MEEQKLNNSRERIINQTASANVQQSQRIEKAAQQDHPSHMPPQQPHQMAQQPQQIPSAPHINADILNQIRGAQQQQQQQHPNVDNSIYQSNTSSFQGVPMNSFPDDIQAAMAKQHHQLHDGSFMPGQPPQQDMANQRANNELRKAAGQVAAGGGQLQQPPVNQGLPHNTAISESYEVKIMSTVVPSRIEAAQMNKTQVIERSKAPMTDTEMQQRISRQQQQQQMQQLENGGLNNQSMASISSSNSVIIPGEKAYQHEMKRQQQQQQISTSMSNVNVGVNPGHRTSKSQTAQLAQQVPQPTTVGGTVRVSNSNNSQLYFQQQQQQNSNYNGTGVKRGNINDQLSDTGNQSRTMFQQSTREVNTHSQHILTGIPGSDAQQQSNQQYSGPSGKLTLCPYHGRSYVAYCSLHSELVCEECCDLSHHRDHNNQILLLKAAAQNFLQDIDERTSNLMQSRQQIAQCEKFNLKNQLRKSIIDFFDSLHTQLELLQKAKLDEFSRLLKDTNFINVQLKAKELDQRAEICTKFFNQKRDEFSHRDYVSVLQQTGQIEKTLKKSEQVIRETKFLMKESEKQMQVELLQEKQKAKQTLTKVVEQTIKMPLVGYNREMVDTLHFFVYNTHNLFMYNFSSHSYRSYVVNIKIPANFMSVENEEGRIFLTGGGEPGKATKSCYEFIDERLEQRRDMIFERRAHTLTSVLAGRSRSRIYAIGSSLPSESMNKCEVYDVASDTWTQVASLNTRRNFHTTIAFDNQALYVVAGFNGGQRTNLIEKYDIQRRQHWETLNLRIKENTNWICLEGCGLYQISNKHILIFGGFTTSDQKTNHCYLFNTSTNDIEQLNCKTRTQSNFYQRQPKVGADGKLYCVETNSLDLHIFDMNVFEWDFIDRKFIGW